MNLRDVITCTVADFQAGNPVIWKGPPGYGKTDASLKLYHRFRDWYRKTVKAEAKVGLCRTFMATKQSVDFTGLPWKGSRTIDGVTFSVTDPTCPGWFMSDPRYSDGGESLPASCYDVVFLIIEEWGQGEPETKRAAAPLLWEAGIDPFYLPPGSPRLALTNIDSRDGVTREFDFVIGRRGEYTVTGDAQVWLDDFADHYYEHNGRKWLTMGATRAWAKQNPQILFEAKPEKQGPWCNPRTLCMADRYAQVAAEQNNGRVPVENPVFADSIAGKIGMSGAASYIDTLRFQIDLPQYDDVVADPMGTPIPEKIDMQTLMVYSLSGLAQPQDMGNLLTYVTRKAFPKDMQLAFGTALLRRDWRTFNSLPPMQAWIAKNATLIALVTGQSN